MTGPGRLIVHFSAALLPARVRDRYREQWLGELRDAPALGLRSSEIAMGSLAFASTFSRTTPSRRRPSPSAISRRARLSVVLAASAAVLAFSQNASAPWNAQTGTDAVSAAVGTVWTVLTMYIVIAPLAALIAAFATRGMNGWVRGAVVVSAAICTVPLTPAINTISTSRNELLYLPLATIAVPALGLLAALVVLAVSRRVKTFDSGVPALHTALRLGRGGLAGVAVAVVAGAGFAALSILWDSRSRLRYGGPKPSADYDQWLAIKTSVEQTVSVTIGAWLTIGIFLACAIAVLTSNRRATPRRIITLTVIALTALVLSFGSLLSFLQFMLPSVAPSFPIGLGTEVVEAGLVVLLLALAARKQTNISDVSEPDVTIDLIGSAHE